MIPETLRRRLIYGLDLPHLLMLIEFSDLVVYMLPRAYRSILARCREQPGRAGEHAGSWRLSAIALRTAIEFIKRKDTQDDTVLLEKLCDLRDAHAALLITLRGSAVPVSKVNKDMRAMYSREDGPRAPSKSRRREINRMGLFGPLKLIF